VTAEGADEGGDRGEQALLQVDEDEALRLGRGAEEVGVALQEGRDETDESAAVERLGGIEIRAVYARYANPKLTFPADLARMTALLGDRA
jgi:hypothetical protein